MCLIYFCPLSWPYDFSPSSLILFKMLSRICLMKYLKRQLFETMPKNRCSMFCFVLLFFFLKKIDMFPFQKCCLLKCQVYHLSMVEMQQNSFALSVPVWLHHFSYKSMSILTCTTVWWIFHLQIAQLHPSAQQALRRNTVRHRKLLNVQGGREIWRNGSIEKKLK